MKLFLLSLMAVMTANLAFSNLSADTIDTSTYPTLGNPEAKVQVVAFLEPKCPDSKRYNNESFPKLLSEFINTNKIRYSVVTTSFLSQSMPAAIALLCVYDPTSTHPSTDLFFKYLNYIYKVQPPEKQNWATIDTLLKFAAMASPTINLDQLKKCIKDETYRTQVEKNTDFGNQLMGHLSTPTIFVDGVKVENSKDTIDYDNLKNAILKALQKKSERD